MRPSSTPQNLAEALDSARSVMPFPIAIPDYIPQGFRLTSVGIDVPSTSSPEPSSAVSQNHPTMYLDYRSPDAEIEIAQSDGPVITEDAPATPVSLGDAMGELRRHLDPMGRPALSLTWSIDGAYYRVTAIPDGNFETDDLVRIVRSLRTN